VLVLEHDPSQAGALRAAAEASGFQDATTGRDLAGRDRYLRATRAPLSEQAAAR
jgi:release factor glutamine methyltransferase